MKYSAAKKITCHCIVYVIQSINIFSKWLRKAGKVIVGSLSPKDFSRGMPPVPTPTPPPPHPPRSWHIPCSFTKLFSIYSRSAPTYIGSMIMNYSTEPFTPTWMSFTFLLANHLLNQFLFCILMGSIWQTYKQKEILIVIIPVRSDFIIFKKLNSFNGAVYCKTSQNGLNGTLGMVYKTEDDAFIWFL